MGWVPGALVPAYRAVHRSAAAASPSTIHLARRRRCIYTVAAPGGASAAGNTNADDDKLAQRLRLGHNWREAVGAGLDSVTAAYDLLVARGCLQPNPPQAAVAAALDQLPTSLTKAREARLKWEAEQVRLTKLAEAAAERTLAERKKAASWSKEEGLKAWLKRSPDTPTEPAVVGPMCWLSVGPPPALHPAGSYIYGSVGSGKSTLMDLFCLFGASKWAVRRQHFHEFSLWLHQSLLKSPDEAGTPQKHILARVADRVAQGIDIFCLDEFVITNVADAAILRELLRLLSERHVAVICTTNRPPEDLYKDGLHHEHYIPALTEHLRQNFLVMPVHGLDYREKLFQAEFPAEVSAASSIDTPPPPVLFVGGSAESALQSALADSAGKVPHLASRTVKVSWGRSFVVPGASGGIARFHFDDLCRCPLAADDFLHLVKQFHTFFLHDVPRLAMEEHNEARRFTNLIDVLYEHNVLLFCHCQVALEDVLTGVEALHNATADDHDAESLGVHQAMYDDSPNFQLQIMELGSREKYKELRDKKYEAEMQLAEAKRLRRLTAPDAAEGDTGSGWSAAPAGGDLSAPDQGVAGVMVAAVGSLQESGFAARRAISRLKEMQTQAYLKAARQRCNAMENTVI